MPAAFPATDAEVACSTHLGPGWVLEAPQGDQPGRVTDTTITPFAFDCDADAHSVSGLTSRIDSDVPSPSANFSSAGATACPPRAFAELLSYNSSISCIGKEKRVIRKRGNLGFQGRPTYFLFLGLLCAF